ncbi:MAG: YggS family pyridoxal phosphate-dependent enzyme [bacterium]
MNIKERLEIIREKIRESARKSGRKEEDIILLAACKGVDSSRVAEAIREGIKYIGDNYVQEAVKRKGELCELAPSVQWHFIGHLQTNKAKKAVELFDMVQTVDSLHLAKEIAKRAREKGKEMPVLIEVNIGEEPTKFGVKPGDLLPFLEEVAQFEGIRIWGLMTMGPPLGKEEMRPYFRRMKDLFDKAEERFKSEERIQMRILSMGMSSDYDVAIEEGANLVRLGTAIFGERR